MFLKHEESIFNLHLRLQNIIRFGTVKSSKDMKVLVQFSEDCEIWLKPLWLKSGESHINFPFEKGETVLVLSPDGDLSEGVIWGAIPKAKPKTGFSIKTKDTSVFESKKGFYFGNGKDELIDLLIQGFKIISQSKTPTLMGPQTSVESFTELPKLVTKMESLHASGH